MEGFLIGVVLVSLAIYIPYRLVKWVFSWVSVRMFPFSERRMKELEYAIQGIGYHVYQKCIVPFGKDIRGKKFKSIDWNALKEKHRYPGHSDEANFFNEIFFGEVDAVLKDAENQLDYINDAWVNTDYTFGGRCVSNHIRDHIKSNKFSETYENYIWLNKLGRECADAWNEQVKEQRIQSALDGEYEAPEESEEEPEYEPESSYESAPVVNNYYAAAVAPTKEKRKDFPTTSKLHGYEIWRHYGASPMKYSERLSQASAISLAEMACRNGPVGAAWSVREKQTGATIWNGNK